MEVVDVVFMMVIIGLVVVCMIVSTQFEDLKREMLIHYLSRGQRDLNKKTYVRQCWEQK